MRMMKTISLKKVTFIINLNNLVLDKEKKNGKKDDSDNEEKSGIEKLKDQKKRKQIDDIWAMMQEEDDLKRKSKIQKTSNNP